MKRGALAFVVLATMGVSIACDESPTAPSPTELAGSWRLSSLQPANETSPVSPPSNATFTVEFANDRVSVRADCNTCGGQYTFDGLTFSSTALACTRVFCQTANLGDTFAQLLQSATTLVLAPSGTLLMQGPEGVVTLTR